MQRPLSGEEAEDRLQFALLCLGRCNDFREKVLLSQLHEHWHSNVWEMIKHEKGQRAAPTSL